MSSPFEFKPLWLYLWSWSCQGPGLSQIWIRIRNRIFRRRQDNGFPPQNKKKREKDRKTFVAFQWKTFSGNRWSANYACSCSAAFFFVCFVFTFREALKAFGLLMFVQNLGGSIWVLLHSVSACRFYSDLSWPKWFGLSLIYQPSKAELLACGLLKHVSTSAGWVAFHVAAIAFPPLVWARIAAGHFAAFSSSCRSYFDFCFSTEEALERRRRRQRLQALKYLKCGTDDGGGHSEWQQIRQLMLTIFYDIYILENCLCWFILYRMLGVASSMWEHSQWVGLHWED